MDEMRRAQVAYEEDHDPRDVRQVQGCQVLQGLHLLQRHPGHLLYSVISLEVHAPSAYAHLTLSRASYHHLTA